MLSHLFANVTTTHCNTIAHAHGHPSHQALQHTGFDVPLCCLDPCLQVWGRALPCMNSAWLGSSISVCLQTEPSSPLCCLVECLQVFTGQDVVQVVLTIDGCLLGNNMWLGQSVVAKHAPDMALGWMFITGTIGTSELLTAHTQSFWLFRWWHSSNGNWSDQAVFCQSSDRCQKRTPLWR